MFERFTKEARSVVIRARREAEEMHHPTTGTEHLLLGLLTVDGLAGTVLRGAGLDAAAVRAAIVREVGAEGEFLGEADAEALKAIGIDLDAVRSTVEDWFGPTALRPPQEPSPSGRRRWLSAFSGVFSSRAKKVLELSLREALALRHNYIGTEHILLGLLREGNGLAALILVRAGQDLTALRHQTLAALHKAA